MRFNLLSKGLLALIFVSVFSIFTSCDGDEPAEPAVKDIPRDGLVAFYPFNGNANDESGVGDSANAIFSGTPNPAVLTTDRFGNPNSAYQIEQDNSIEVLDSEKIRVLGDFAFSAWVKLSTSGYIIDTSRHYLEFDQSTNEIIVRISEDATNSIYLKKVIANPGEWHFICATWDETNQIGKLYIDGQLEAQENPSLNVINTTGDAMYFGDYNFSGIIDDIAIYNEALTSPEVESLFQQNITK
ncbi:LamG domain-containing protein [Mangrovivirga sp. M17]|uniref:LamG domain-containing protein n=1 Tax=Mangrovivirga halotolerans TaxID=2993936 RepID=A0ABT3RLL1_9BACT|nr:LamG domain-containing protein [Mangrovivirga halotolerans]MCX2742676.1 LamG domain-containing protein [Mangrovivirga halotolerans]